LGRDLKDATFGCKMGQSQQVVSDRIGRLRQLGVLFRRGLRLNQMQLLAARRFFEPDCEPLRDDVGRIIAALDFRRRHIADQERGARRYDLINSLIEARGFQTYLEIGVRNPEDCYSRIHAARKWSVDPGFESQANSATFPVTSDEFFGRLDAGELDGVPERWDVIFVDGLHRAEQVWRDIENSLRYLSPGGVVFLHDCLPPSESFAREQYSWTLETDHCWNGTCWKAFSRYLETGKHAACVVASDWGVGVIDSSRSSDTQPKFGSNPFFEFDVFVRSLDESKRRLEPEEFLSDWARA